MLGHPAYDASRSVRRRVTGARTSGAPTQSSLWWHHCRRLLRAERSRRQYRRHRLRASVQFLHGGGFLVLQTSAGLYPGQRGSKNNSGFNVKYNKAGTTCEATSRDHRNNVQVYQIKGNSMTSLATTRQPRLRRWGTTVFNGKAKHPASQRPGRAKTSASWRRRVCRARWPTTSRRC